MRLRAEEVAQSAYQQRRLVRVKQLDASPHRHGHARRLRGIFQTPKGVIKTINKMPIFAKNVDCEDFADVQEADQEMTPAVATEEDKNKARVMDEKNLVWSMMIGMFKTFLT